MAGFLPILNRNIKKIVANKYFPTNFSLPRKLGNEADNYVNDELENREYEDLARDYLPYGIEHGCLIIHPYIKWGPQKVQDTSPKSQLDEAVSLVETLGTWKIRERLIVSLDNFEKKSLFGSGNVKKIGLAVRGDPQVTAVFINVGNLKSVQKEELEKEFQVSVVDRYNVVMMILKLHATSKHAKLQVALAEVTYIQRRLKKSGSVDFETKKRMLQIREQKIKNGIKKLRMHRELLRSNRKRHDFPVIAVVGYTNAGKTSLIKALTKDENLQPKNQLFATLDVTLHAGFLPSTLQVLYVDTVGFISNIPTTLIECFVVTLEDALYADVILHVEDLSSENLIHQRNHVKSTLKNFSDKINDGALLNKIISVGNKCDLVENIPPEVFRVSAKTEVGMDVLRHRLEQLVLENTGREVKTVKVPTGGEEARWLYKNSTVVNAAESKPDGQFQNITIIITKAKLQQFKHHFITNKT